MTTISLRTKPTSVLSRRVAVFQTLHLRWLALGLLGLLGPAWPSLGAKIGPATVTSDASDQQDIVVNGRILAGSAVSDYVNAVTVQTSTQRIAKFDAPVCPSVVGLPAEYSKVIVDRMRLVARSAGAAVADGRCRPNIMVIVTDDVRALTASLRDRVPTFTLKSEGGRSADEASKRGAAVAWHGLETTSVDGRHAGPGWFQGREVSFMKNVANSNIATSTKEDIIVAYVILPRARVEGLSLEQIADYAAMRTLARTKADQPLRPGLTTILTVLDEPRQSGDQPLHLTAVDTAYLKALYATSNAVSGNLQVSSIRAVMQRALATPKLEN